MKSLVRNASLWIIICSNISACANSDPANYFVRLGEIGEARVKSKYGAGRYYFYRSNYRFSGTSDVREKEEFFSQVERERENICLRNFTLIKETLSYYSESGSVSVLVKCAESLKK